MVNSQEMFYNQMFECIGRDPAKTSAHTKEKIALAMFKTKSDSVGLYSNCDAFLIN